MHCHYCGTELRDNEIFCRLCGTRRQNVERPAPAPVFTATEPSPVAPPAVEIPAPPVVAEAPVSRPVEYQQKNIDWQPYGAPVAEEPLLTFNTQAPALKLPVKRSLAKMIFLGIITLGIYPLVIWSRLSGEVNLVASRYDGQRSIPFLGMVLLAPLTLGILPLVWINKLCCRIGNELMRRGISYHFGAKDFWLWAFLLGGLGSICAGICGVIGATGSDSYVILIVLLSVFVLTLIGPMVFIAKLMKAMNRLNEDFNTNG